MKESSDLTFRETVRKLLEKHHPSKVFQILAENVLQPKCPVETQSTLSEVETESHKIMISKEKLRQLRNERAELVRIPANKDEVRGLVQKWKRGEPVRNEDLVGMILYSSLSQRECNRGN